MICELEFQAMPQEFTNVRARKVIDEEILYSGCRLQTRHAVQVALKGTDVDELITGFKKAQQAFIGT